MSQISVFEIPERFTIAQAQQVYEELNGLLESEEVESIVLDAGEVMKIDAAGLQILLSFYRTAEKFHKSVQWRNPSNEMIDCAAILGVSKALALDNTVN